MGYIKRDLNGISINGNCTNVKEIYLGWDEQQVGYGKRKINKFKDRK